MLRESIKKILLQDRIVATIKKQFQGKFVPLKIPSNLRVVEPGGFIIKDCAFHMDKLQVSYELVPGKIYFSHRQNEPVHTGQIVANYLSHFIRNFVQNYFSADIDVAVIRNYGTSPDISFGIKNYGTLLQEGRRPNPITYQMFYQVPNKSSNYYEAVCILTIKGVKKDALIIFLRKMTPFLKMAGFDGTIGAISRTLRTGYISNDWWAPEKRRSTRLSYCSLEKEPVDEWVRVIEFYMKKQGIQKIP